VSDLFYDRRFTANQFILAPGPLSPMATNLFFQLNPCGVSPYVNPLWWEDAFVSYECAWLFVKCTFHTYNMLKIPTLTLYTSPLSAQALQSRSCLTLRILCYNGPLIIWTVVSLTTTKFKLFIFSMSGFTLPYTANMFILMILYDFCFSLAQICYK
jgi:hypothetical protein